MKNRLIGNNSLANKKLLLEVILLTMSFILLFFPSLVTVIILFVVALLSTLIIEKKGERLRSLGIGKIESFIKVILSCALIGAFVEIFFQSVINPVLERVCHKNIDLNNFFFIKNNLAFFVVMVIYGWLQGALIEEILFRGFILKRFLIISSTIKCFRQSKKVIVVILSSILFASIHRYQGLSGVISTGLISLIFGYSYIRCHYQLIIPVMLHGFINTTAFTIIYFNGNDTLRNLLIR